LKAHKTSGGGRTPVRHTIPLGIVIFLVLPKMPVEHKKEKYLCGKYRNEGEGW